LGEITVSVEALAYVKMLDLGECEKARLLMYVIGENTFNDTFVCRVGIEELAFQTRINEKTVRRQLAALEARVSDDGKRRRRYVLRARRNGVDGGRRFDDIRIVGYKRWYLKNYTAAKRAHKAKNGEGNRDIQPGKMSVSQPGKMSGSNRTAVSGSNRTLVSGTYKDSRTSPRTSEDALSARKDSISDFEVKVRAELRTELGDKVFSSWFANVRFLIVDTVARVEAPQPFVRKWILEHYGDLVRRVCKGADAGISDVTFTITAKGDAR
jgi:hypothetical protein